MFGLYSQVMLSAFKSVQAGLLSVSGSPAAAFLIILKPSEMSLAYNINLSCQIVLATV